MNGGRIHKMKIGSKEKRKRSMIILFRIAYGFLFIAMVCLIIFSVIRRMRGNILVTVDGEEYILENLTCTTENGDAEKITYAQTDSGLVFKNAGANYGMYEYSFAVSNEEFHAEPKIRILKTNWWEIYDMTVKMDIYKESGVWNAGISVDVNGMVFQERFIDIENNTIEFRAG